MYCAVVDIAAELPNMANNEALHRCVTKFMLGTCQPRSEYADVLRLFYCLARHSIGNAEMFASGSSAEFCIKPMLSCIGDFDVMAAYHCAVAIPVEHIPPSDLPSHYGRLLCAFEFVDSHQPGFVYVRRSHTLTKGYNGLYVAERIENSPPLLSKSHVNVNTHESIWKWFKRCTNHEFQNNRLVQSLLTPPIVVHGPAINLPIFNDIFTDLYKTTHLQFSQFSIDFVECMRCLLWPPQAADWPTRNRGHGVPDHTTINTIVNNGCDLVAAVHPRCREDEWMNEHQWRLSFSRAEVTLLNSWTPVQQIIYHMLRYVLKREVFSKFDDNNQYSPKLSNYHIKTLMLWECEQKPQSWWSAESSLIKLCSSLLHKLSDWVEDNHCQHYFISNCNLLGHFVEKGYTMISNSLTILADESFLLSWFVENYISRCAQYCSDNVSVLFRDIATTDKLERAVNAAVEWKLNTLAVDRCTDYYKCEMIATIYVLLLDTNAMWTQMVLRDLENVDPRLRDYFVALTSLRVAYTISIKSSAEDLLEILWALFNTCSAADGDISNGIQQSGGLLCIQRGVKLSTLFPVSNNALEMLHNEMSKAYLHHSFAYEQESTYCVVHVLLAALYYKSGDYRTVIYHCEEVFKQSGRRHYITPCIGMEYLPQIDENVTSVFGLILLYQHLQRKAVKPDTQQRGSKLAVTIQLLAHYFYSKCSPVADSGSRRIRIYRQRLYWTESPLLCDILLFKEMEIQLEECICTCSFAVNTRTGEADDTSSSIDTRLLATLLELVALAKLVSVRQVVVRELHSEQYPVLNEFAALYSYRCGLLEECLDMCRRNVDTLLRAGCPRYQHYPIVMTEFLSMLDGEVLSLFGIIRLLCPVTFLFLVEFADNESISLLTLSVYLMVQCQKTLRSDSLCDTLQLIRVVYDKLCPADGNKTFFDCLILKLTYRSLKLYVDSSASADQRSG